MPKYMDFIPLQHQEDGWAWIQCNKMKNIILHRQSYNNNPSKVNDIVELNKFATKFFETTIADENDIKDCDLKKLKLPLKELDRSCKRFLKEFDIKKAEKYNTLRNIRLVETYVYSFLEIDADDLCEELSSVKQNVLWKQIKTSLEADGKVSLEDFNSTPIIKTTVTRFLAKRYISYNSNILIARHPYYLVILTFNYDSRLAINCITYLILFESDNFSKMLMLK
uniref:Uncharacterized protein n=1 Tax=Strigamia maritima TaxID=126957 RepID=T1IK95_STRMM